MSGPHPSQFQSRLGMAQTVSRQSITGDTWAWHIRLVSISYHAYPGMAQTVGRRSLTADTRAETQASSVGHWVYKVAVGKDFLQVFGFSLVSIIPPVLRTYSYICLRQWLRTGRSGDRIPVGARFSAPVQTGPGAHPASCTMGTGFFRGVKSGRGMTLTPQHLLVPW